MYTGVGRWGFQDREIVVRKLRLTISSPIVVETVPLLVSITYRVGGCDRYNPRITDRENQEIDEGLSRS